MSIVPIIPPSCLTSGVFMHLLTWLEDGSCNGLIETEYIAEASFKLEASRMGSTKFIKSDLDVQLKEGCVNTLLDVVAQGVIDRSLEIFSTLSCPFTKEFLIENTRLGRSHVGNTIFGVSTKGLCEPPLGTSQGRCHLYIKTITVTLTGRIQVNLQGRDMWFEKMFLNESPITDLVDDLSTCASLPDVGVELIPIYFSDEEDEGLINDNLLDSLMMD